MACCRCNRSGRCQNCSCVKNGSMCRGCLPQRLGKCVNTLLTPPPGASDQTSTLPLTENSLTRCRSSSPSSPSLVTVNATSPKDSPPNHSPLSRVPETPPPCQSASESPPCPLAPESLSCSPAPEPSPPLNIGPSNSWTSHQQLMPPSPGAHTILPP